MSDQIESDYSSHLMTKYGSLNFKRPAPENLHLAKSFIRCAEMDLTASEILSKEGIFSLSVFHAQQSVEKLCKAYLLTFGVVDMNFLKKEIGHNSPLIFSKMVEIMSDFIPLIKQASPGMNTNIVGLIDLVTGVNKALKYKEEPPGIVKPTYISILEALENYDTFSAEAITKATPALKLVMNLIFKPERISDWDQPNPEMDELINSSIEKVSNNFSLIVLAVITFPHEQCTRYPDMKPSPEDYSSDFGIVRALPIILERTRKVQVSLLNYVEMFESPKVTT